MVRIRVPRLAAAVATCVMLAGCARGVSCRPPSAPATTGVSAAEGRFAILQINDVYKVEGLEGGAVGGLSRVRTLRARLEAEGTPVLVLHAGDLLFPSVMSKFLRAQPMIRCLNLLDGDPVAFDPRLVVTFGNHEFDDKDPGLVLGRVAQSDFPWVSSNVLYRTTKDAPGEPFSRRLRNVHDAFVVDVGGVRVGIVALTADAQPRDYVAYGWEEKRRFGTVAEQVARVRAEGARFVVALTHQDMADDVRLAEQFAGIDVVVGGHEHFFQQRRVGRTWVTKADSDARTAVVLDVRVPLEGPPEVGPRKVVLDASTAKDPVVEAEAQASLVELGKAVRAQTGRDLLEVLGTTEHALEGVEPAVRGRETALGNFLADVVRDRMRTEVAFVNGGAIRINDDVPSGGEIRRYEMEGIFYFDNRLVACEVTGAQLLDLLRTSVALVHSGHGRFLQVSGIRFAYHVGGTDDAPTYRIDASDVSVVDASGNAAPLDLARTYSAGTIDYLHENGFRDGYALFSKGAGGTSPPTLDRGPPVFWRAATEEAIAALPGRRVTARIEGRITAARP